MVFFKSILPVSQMGHPKVNSSKKWHQTSHCYKNRKVSWKFCGVCVAFVLRKGGCS